MTGLRFGAVRSPLFRPAKRKDGGAQTPATDVSADQKQQIIAKSLAPGASVAEVARRYGLNSNLLFTWRRREQAANGASDVGEPVNIVPVRCDGCRASGASPALGGSNGDRAS